MSGFIQYLQNSPYIIAAILFGFGVASCFFGGLLWDYVVGSLAGIIVFFISAAIMDGMGGFSILEQGVKANAGNVISCIVCFAVVLAAAGGAGWVAAKTN